MIRFLNNYRLHIFPFYFLFFYLAM
jgi:hypothetical protein